MYMYYRHTGLNFCHVGVTILLFFLAFVSVPVVNAVVNVPKRSAATFSGWQSSTAIMINPAINPSAVLMGRYLLFIGGSQLVFKDIRFTTLIEYYLLSSIQALDLESTKVFTPQMLIYGNSQNVDYGDSGSHALPLPPRAPAMLFSPAVGTTNTVRIGLAAYVVGFCSMIPSAVTTTGEENEPSVRNFLRSLQVIRLVQEEFAPEEDLTLNISEIRFPYSVTPRFNATCAGNGVDTIYIFGGVSYLTGESLASVSQYNISSGQFIDAEWPLGSKLIGPGVVEGSDLFFLAGGYTRHGTALRSQLSVFIFDPKALKFSDSVMEYAYLSLGWFTPQLFLYNRTLAVMGATGGVTFDRQAVWPDVTCRGDDVMASVDVGLPVLRGGAVLAAVPGPNAVKVFLAGGQLPPPYGGGLSEDVFSGTMLIEDAHVPVDVLGFHYIAALFSGGELSEEEKGIQREHEKHSREVMTREKVVYMESIKNEFESLDEGTSNYVSPSSARTLSPEVTEGLLLDPTPTITPSITVTIEPPPPPPPTMPPFPPDVPDEGENITIRVNGYRPLWYNFSFSILFTENLAAACPEIQPSKSHSLRVSPCLVRLSSSPNCNSPLLDMGNLTSLNAIPYEVKRVDPDTNVTTIKKYIAVGPIRLIGSLPHGIHEISSAAAYTSSSSKAWSKTKPAKRSMSPGDSTNSTYPFYEQIFMYVCFSSSAASLSVCEQAEIRPVCNTAEVPCTTGLFKPLNAEKPFVLSHVTHWVPFPPTKPPRPIPPTPHLSTTIIVVIALLCVIIISLIFCVTLWTLNYRRKRHVYSKDTPLLESYGETNDSEDDDERGRYGRGAVLPAHQKRGLLDGKYRVVRRLGRGSFSVVYLVERVTDGSRFALKYVQCADDVDRLEAMRECEVAYSLQGHPNVIRLVDMFMSYRFDTNVDGERRGGLVLSGKEWDLKEQPVILRVDSELDKATRHRAAANTGERYLSLVMAYHEKGDLGKWIRQQKSEPIILETTVVSIAFQILSVLQFMHHRNPPIIHRDLKPENILLSSLGEGASNLLRITLTDFGLSRVMDKTFCETGVGSLPYVAPECWQRRYSTKVDIWAVGCIIYAACARRVESDNVKVMFSECNRPDFKKKLVEELTVVYGYSEEIAAFIVYLLEPDPNRRPSAEEALRLIHKRRRNAVGEDSFESMVSIYKGHDSSEGKSEEDGDVIAEKGVTDSATDSARDVKSDAHNSAQTLKLSRDAQNSGSGFSAPRAESSSAAVKTVSAPGDAGERLALLKLQKHDAYFASIEEDLRSCDFFVVKESAALVAALAQQQLSAHTLQAPARSGSGVISANE